MQSQHLAAYSLKENIGEDVGFYMFQDGRANFDLFDFLLTWWLSVYMYSYSTFVGFITSGRDA